MHRLISNANRNTTIIRAGFITADPVGSCRDHIDLLPRVPDREIHRRPILIEDHLRRRVFLVFPADGITGVPLERPREVPGLRGIEHPAAESIRVVRLMFEGRIRPVDPAQILSSGLDRVVVSRVAEGVIDAWVELSC
ncbi:hypothetical protein BDW72DRAFT_185501 [Aspergillus terricola var. indicus]